MKPSPVSVGCLMHQCRHITLPIVRCLPLHRVVQLLQTSLYTLIVIVATDERVVEGVLGGGRGSELAVMGGRGNGELYRE